MLTSRLAFLDQVIAGPDVTENVFNDARRCFSDQALVEIVTMQVCAVMNKFSLVPTTHLRV
jgi:hypothetical protein